MRYLLLILPLWIGVLSYSSANTIIDSIRIQAANLANDSLKMDYLSTGYRDEFYKDIQKAKQYFFLMDSLGKASSENWVKATYYENMGFKVL